MRRPRGSECASLHASPCAAARPAERECAEPCALQPQTAQQRSGSLAHWWRWGCGVREMLQQQQRAAEVAGVQATCDLAEFARKDSHAQPCLFQTVIQTSAQSNCTTKVSVTMCMRVTHTLSVSACVCLSVCLSLSTSLDLSRPLSTSLDLSLLSVLHHLLLGVVFGRTIRTAPPLPRFWTSLRTLMQSGLCLLANAWAICAVLSREPSSTMMISKFGCSHTGIAHHDAQRTKE